MTDTAFNFTFSLNRTCAPQMSLPEFLRLAHGVGVDAIELRNDMGGELSDMPHDELRDLLDRAQTRVSSVNALQRFNDMTPARLAEARELASLARAFGAVGVVLCPLIDPDIGWGDTERATRLRDSLSALRPVFAGSGVMGLVEPLGMHGSTMKIQSEAVEAIEDIDGWDAFRLCHDTFQFYRCGDTRMFPEHFGMVHISGIARPDLSPAELDEPDRGLVFAGDRAGNVAQLNKIVAAGYRGPISMEPFDPEIQSDPALSARLAASFDYIRATVGTA
ncbi:TIM barrel protein [Celeribacter sp.]|uniref:TIM barrel protein n=1 Tax=Celeribacter sp. TaxID=1890673 RepID=UPI003A92DB69